MIGLLSCITSVITIDSGADMVHVAFHIGSPTSPAETIERVPPGSQSRTRAIGVTFLFSSAILRPFEDMTRRACANNAKSTPFNAQPSCSPVASDSINFPLINSLFRLSVFCLGFKSRFAKEYLFLWFWGRNLGELFLPTRNAELRGRVVLFSFIYFATVSDRVRVGELFALWIRSL